MNRRILISEDEKLRILGLHETRKRSEWNLLFEQATTASTTANTASTTANTATTTASTQTCTVAPGLKGMDDEVKFRTFAKKNYGQETVAFGKVSIPGFVDKPAVFCNPKYKALGVVYNHKPASGGGKTIGELYLAGESGGGSASGATSGATTATTAVSYYVYLTPGQKPITMEQKDLEAKIMSGEVKKETLVWKKGMEKPAPAGEQADLKAFFEAVPPELQAPSERKSTGVPELDAWLKTPTGKAWDETKDPKLKEKMFDSFESADPTIKGLVNKMGKGKVRSALGVGADTMLGRMFQKGRAKLGAAITGNQPQA